MINEDCIICHACEPECPNNAIYEDGAPWNWATGTKLTEVVWEDGNVMDAAIFSEPLSNIVYYIVPGKCTECMGFHEEPQCAAVCPVDSYVSDPDHKEDEEKLLRKKAWLHGEEF